MIILEHSTYADATIAASLGLPEYSYWFVRKAFAPILDRAGIVVPITSPETEVDRIFRSAQASGQACVFLSFSPPHQTLTDLACPTAPVFAWEYDTIPDEPWNGEAVNDWREVLARVPAAVTHSRFSLGAVRQALGADYPVWSIPAPIADRQLGLETSARGWRDRFELDVSDAFMFDSWAIDLSLFAYGADAQSEQLMRHLQGAARRTGRRSHRIELGGVVYASVLNPVDGRKNWADMVAGFIYAFRDEAQATLILKTTHRDLNEAVTPILQDLAKLGRFRCRVLILHGLLDDAEYARLIEASAYAVNTSHGEGQCLPLMEFMAAGRPAVAPRHTAMIEYVSPDNAFVVADHHRPAYWPHDVRQASRCLRHQIEFADLVRRYRESFAVARDRPERYAAMSKAAIEALRAFCGDAVVAGRLAELLDYLAPDGEGTRRLETTRASEAGKRPLTRFPTRAPGAAAATPPPRRAAARAPARAEPDLFHLAEGLDDDAPCPPSLRAALDALIAARRAMGGVEDGPPSPKLGGLRVRRAGLPDWWTDGGNLLLMGSEAILPELKAELYRPPPRGAVVAIGSRGHFNHINIGREGALVVLGDDISAHGAAMSCLGRSSVLIGEATTCTNWAMVDCRNGGCIVVGADGMWAHGVSVLTDDTHAIRDIATGQRVNTFGGRIVIGPHVWLCEQARVLDGARVGANAVVGSGALVKGGAIPADVVAVGVPARPVRTGVTWSREDAP